MNRQFVGLIALTLSVGCLPVPFPGLTTGEPGLQTAGSRFNPDEAAVALTSHSTDSITITGLFPSQAKAGETITIAGMNFSDTAVSNSVVFGGGATATPTTADFDSLVVTVPASASSGLLRVDVGSQSSNRFYFSVSQEAAPSLSSTSPGEAYSGATITVYGSGFSTTASENVVNFGTLEVTPSFADKTSLIVMVPSGVSTNQLWVRVNGVNSNRLLFKVPIAVGELFPDQGTPGQELRVRGYDFGSPGLLSLSGVTATYSAWTSNEIVGTIPTAVSGPLVVTSNGGQGNVPFKVLTGVLSSNSGSSSRLSRARFGASMIRLGRNLYVMGGYDGSTYSNTIEKAIINHDGSIGAFSILSPITFPHGSNVMGGAVRIKDYMYIAGGYDSSATLVSTVSRATVASDNSLSAFATVSGVTLTTGGTGGHALRVIKNYLYTFGGYNGTQLSAVSRAPIYSDGTIGNFRKSSPCHVVTAGGRTASLVLRTLATV